MNVVQLLKVCVLAAFVGTMFTGVLFIMRSSDEQQIKTHIKDLSRLLPKYGNDQMPEKPKSIRRPDELEKEIRNQQKGNNDEVKKSKGDVVQVGKIPSMLAKVTSTTLAPPSTTTTISVTTPVPEQLLAETKALKESSRIPSVHIFYYPWYGSPEFNNGKYYHWNHEILKPWDHKDKHKYPTGHHSPPDDIASSYYPRLGPYSSSDPSVMEQHMKWISSAGIDVVAVSWYPKNKADEEGLPWDTLMPLLLNVTDKYKMKIAFHLEPYKGRTAESVKDDIKYIITNYGKHPAFYRTTGKSTQGVQKELPLFYIYDSYRIPVDSWLDISSPDGSSTIRNTEWDALLIGLYVNADDKDKIKEAKFDGMYTYFASEGFSDGSTMANWPALSAFCASSNLLFIPSVAPGYDDSKVRPWNTKNTKERNNGEYYKEHFKMAHIAKADIVSITSFNEWHEGTQIEPVQAYTNSTKFTYAQYEKGPEQYLEITLEMIKAYFTPHHENIPMQIARIV